MTRRGKLGKDGTMAKRTASPDKPGGEPEVSAATTATKAKRAKAPKRRVITTPRPKTAPPRKRPGQKKRQATRKRKAKQDAQQTAAVPSSPDAPATPPLPERPPGAGGYSAITDPEGTVRRSDIVMLGAALKRSSQRVPVREDVLEAGANKVGRIMLGTTKERTALAAFRLMLTAVQINQADEHKGLPDKLEISAAKPLTVDDQRAAIRAAIAAEKAKRGKR